MDAFTRCTPSMRMSSLPSRFHFGPVTPKSTDEGRVSEGALFKDTEDLDEGGDSASESGDVDQSGRKAKRTRAKKGTDKRNDKHKGKSSRKDTDQTKAKKTSTIPNDQERAGGASTEPAPTPSHDIENKDPKDTDPSGVTQTSTLKRPAESTPAGFANKVPKGQADDHIAKVLGRLQQSGLSAEQVLSKILEVTEATALNAATSPSPESSQTQTDTSIACSNDTGTSTSQSSRTNPNALASFLASIGSGSMPVPASLS